MKILLHLILGGYGDRIVLTAAIPALKQKYPEATIYTTPDRCDLVAFDPRIRIAASNVTTGYDKEVFFSIQNLLDHWDDWESKVFCRHVELEWSEPRYYITDREYAAAPACDIAIAAWADGPDRVYDQMQKVVEELRGYRVIQVDNGPKITPCQPKTTIREAAAIVAKAKVVLTVDTAFMHVAIALKKPTIVVFGKLTGPDKQYMGETGVPVYMHQHLPKDIARKVLNELSTRHR